MSTDQKLNAVRAMMNAGYESGTAYKSSLPFDSMRSQEIRRAVLELAGHLALDPAVTTLDMGCGQGGVVAFWPHRNIIGVELSEVAVKMAKESYPESTFIVGAAEEFAWDGVGFRLITAVETVEHWTNVDAGLHNLRRVIADDGKLVMTTPNRDSLHCRLARKFGFEVPHCSHDHIYEFGFAELIERVQSHGFKLEESRGVCLAPYWALERVVGPHIRRLTDNDEDLNGWLNAIARTAPAEFGFVQAHRFAAA